MIRNRKLEYCPRTKHSKGRWKLKQATARCVFQKDGICGAPALLRYLKHNGIKVRLTDNYICLATIGPDIVKGDSK